MARGKALVAALRADPKVRDAQALAGWIKKRKRLKAIARKAAVTRKQNESEAQLTSAEETDAYRKRVLNAVKRGDRLRVSSGGDSAYGRVIGKTRGGKIRFQPDKTYKGSSKEREIDPADVKQYSEPPSRKGAERVARDVRSGKNTLTDKNGNRIGPIGGRRRG